MDVRKTSLSNGIRVVTSRIPHVRSVSLGLWVNAGARDETPEENGISHFIEHMIFKGTKQRSAYQIAKEFDAIGGHTNAFTAMENTCYYARVLDVHLKTMVDILSDIFINSLFLSEEMERERPVIIQEISMVEDSPEDYIHVLAEKAFWGDHALGRPIMGTRENILQFDDTFLKSFFRRFYQPDRIVISAAGNVDHEELVAMLGSIFEAIPSGSPLPPRIPATGISGISLHPRDLEQTHVCIEASGIPITDSRRHSLSILNSILGGNMSSRLFQNIREKRGLAYSVYSFVNSYVDTGMVGAYGGFAQESVPEAVSLMTREMNRLKTEPVTRDELSEAKEFVKGNIHLALESVESQMVRLAQNELHFSRFLPLDEIIASIEAVSTEDIMDIAQALFRPEHMNLTILGPVQENARDFSGIFSI